LDSIREIGAELPLQSWDGLSDFTVTTKNGTHPMTSSNCEWRPTLMKKISWASNTHSTQLRHWYSSSARSLRQRQPHAAVPDGAAQRRAACARAGGGFNGAFLIRVGRWRFTADPEAQIISTLRSVIETVTFPSFPTIL
jgi:hypothetical protein